MRLRAIRCPAQGYRRRWIQFSRSQRKLWPEVRVNLDVLHGRFESSSALCLSVTGNFSGYVNPPDSISAQLIDLHTRLLLPCAWAASYSRGESRERAKALLKLLKPGYHLDHDLMLRLVQSIWSRANDDTIHELSSYTSWDAYLASLVSSVPRCAVTCS